ATFRDQGLGIWIVVIALSVLAWPMTFRIMRAAVITARSQDFVLAAKALGASQARIMFRHLLPNAIAPVIVIATINLGVFIAAEAALSFLGVGVQSPDISLGLMIADARNRLLEAPLPLVFPAVFLSITVLAFIMLVDAVRDAIVRKLRWEGGDMSKTSLDALQADGGLGNEPLLAVDDLLVEFVSLAGVVRAVNGVSYSLNAGETRAVMGESGSG